MSRPFPKNKLLIHKVAELDYSVMSELTYQRQHGSKEGQVRGTTDVKTRSGKAKQVHLLPGCVHTCSFQVSIGLGLRRIHDNIKSESGQLGVG